MLVFAFFMAFIALGFFFAGMTRTVHAVDPPCTLPDVCEKLDAIEGELSTLDGGVGAIDTDLDAIETELASAQGKLDAIDEKVSLQGYPHAPVAKTGNTISDTPGEDGYLQKGVAWPNPRFTDNGDGTVTDNLTGLMWTKDADIGSGGRTWSEALSDCASCTAGGHSDWRLPNVRELHSLIDYGQWDPALSNTSGLGRWAEDDPFINVQSVNYWSSTTYANNPDLAWYVILNVGAVGNNGKVNGYYVWCVRGGQ